MRQQHVSGVLTAVNYEAEDPQSLAGFWAEATGGTVIAAGDQAYVRPTTPTGVGMFFQKHTAPRPERQVSHVDLTVPWGSRQQLVDRLIARGATRQWDVLDEYPNVQWTAMTDPEGNLFCIAEHPPPATE